MRLQELSPHSPGTAERSQGASSAWGEKQGLLLGAYLSCSSSPSSCLGGTQGCCPVCHAPCPRRMVVYSGDTNRSAVLYDSLRADSVPFEGVISDGSSIRIDFLAEEPAAATAFNIRFEGAVSPCWGPRAVPGSARMRQLWRFRVSPTLAAVGAQDREVQKSTTCPSPSGRVQSSRLPEQAQFLVRSALSDFQLM